MRDDDPATRGTGADASGRHVGSVPEEAERLLGALAGWAREHGEDLATGVSDGAHHWAESVQADQADQAGQAGEAGEDTPCRWCPVCRTADTLRNLNPEVKTHLLVAATSLAQAVAAALETPAPPTRPSHRNDGHDKHDGHGRDDGVERIDLDTQEWEDE